MIKAISLGSVGSIVELDNSLSKWLTDQTSIGCTIISCTWNDAFERTRNVIKSDKEVRVELFRRTTHVVMDMPNDNAYR